ncbi:MAG: replication-associated recombination protein A, partial [Halarcobacter sp.]
DYYYFNATTIKVEDLRKVFIRYKDSFIKPIIFIDEVHRLSKNQQEVLLPIMESYEAIIIGASTENPFFTLTNAIRSRSFLYEFRAFTKEEMEEVLKRTFNHISYTIDNDAREYLILSSSGDARAMLNLLNFAVKIDSHVTMKILKELREYPIGDGVSSKDSHYDLASAMIKSIRGSDVDAALYYLSRLINGGESVDFITRRLVIFASEDIGNANPNALTMAVNTMVATSKIGYPESRIILSQCIIYLTSCPKSNASYMGINKALGDVQNGRILEIPKHLKDKHIGYKYPHDYGGWVEQQYLVEPTTYYDSLNVGYEKTLNEWLKKIKTKDF